MSWLSDFLHPNRGYDAAQNEMNRYFNMGKDVLNPYQQHGLDSYNGLSEVMNKLLNPSQLQDEWMKNYKESEYAKKAEDMATQHGLNAASSMGLMGSTPALQAIQAGTSQIASQDQQKYLDDLMQKYLAGAGIGQGLYNTGAGSASQLMQQMMNMGRDSGQLQYSRHNAGSGILQDLLGRLLGAGGSALSKYLGGM